MKDKHVDVSRLQGNYIGRLYFIWVPSFPTEGANESALPPGASPPAYTVYFHWSFFSVKS